MRAYRSIDSEWLQPEPNQGFINVLVTETDCLAKRKFVEYLYLSVHLPPNEIKTEAIGGDIVFIANYHDINLYFYKDGTITVRDGTGYMIDQYTDFCLPQTVFHTVQTILGKTAKVS